MTELPGRRITRKQACKLARRILLRAERARRQAAAREARIGVRYA